MSQQKQTQKKQVQKKPVSPLIKLCASVGLLTLIPLLIAIIIVSFLNSVTKPPKFERIDAIVVEDLFANTSTIPTGTSTVELTYKNTTSRRRLRVNRPVKINEKIVVFVINEDVNNLQSEEPKPFQLFRIILWFLWFSFFLTIVLYIFKPSLLCALVVINVVMTIVSLVFVKR